MLWGAADIWGADGTLPRHGVEGREAPRGVHRTDNDEWAIGSCYDSEGNVMAIMHETGTL